MGAMVLFLALCLISRFAYSVNDILVGRLARVLTGIEVAAWRGISLGLSMAPWLIWVPRDSWSQLARHGWDLLALLTLTGLANLMQLQASRYMPFGVRAAFIVSGIAAFSGVLGWWVLDERMTWTQAGLSVIVVGSAILTAVGRHASHEFVPNIRRGAAFAIGAAILIACMGLMVAKVARGTHPLLTAWAWEFGGGLVLIGPLLWQYRRGIAPGLPRRIGRIALASAPTALGSGLSAVALTMGSLGVWAAVAGTQVLFTAALGAAWQKELIGPKRWICFAVAAGAVAALGWLGAR